MSATIVIKNNLKNIIILSICIPFIVGGVINRGWSGFFWAIPFVVLYIVFIRQYGLFQKALLILLLFFICIPLAWKKESNKFLYPYLNSEVTFSAGWGFIQYSDSKYYDLISPDSTVFYTETELNRDDYDKPLEIIKKSTTMKMVEMDVSLADFGCVLIPVFEDIEGNKYSIRSSELVKGIRDFTISSEDLRGVYKLQSRWTMNLENLMYWPMAPFIYFSKSG